MWNENRFKAKDPVNTMEKFNFPQKNIITVQPDAAFNCKMIFKRNWCLSGFLLEGNRFNKINSITWNLLCELYTAHFISIVFSLWHWVLICIALHIQYWHRLFVTFQKKETCQKNWERKLKSIRKTCNGFCEYHEPIL